MLYTDKLGQSGGGGGGGGGRILSSHITIDSGWQCWRIYEGRGLKFCMILNLFVLSLYMDLKLLLSF